MMRSASSGTTSHAIFSMISRAICSTAALSPPVAAIPNADAAVPGAAVGSGLGWNAGTGAAADFGIASVAVRPGGAATGA